MTDFKKALEDLNGNTRANPYDVDSCSIVPLKTTSLNAIRKALEIAERMQWRDMDSAPCDGSRFLSRNIYETVVTHWRDNPYGNGISGWGMDTDCTSTWLHPKPIRWMPLPDCTATEE